LQLRKQVGIGQGFDNFITKNISHHSELLQFVYVVIIQQQLFTKRAEEKGFGLDEFEHIK
jgi:hypothetical protein